jgi:hypothetical protein
MSGVRLTPAAHTRVEEAAQHLEQLVQQQQDTEETAM